MLPEYLSEISITIQLGAQKKAVTDVTPTQKNALNNKTQI